MCTPTQYVPFSARPLRQPARSASHLRLRAVRTHQLAVATLTGGVDGTILNSRDVAHNRFKPNPALYYTSNPVPTLDSEENGRPGIDGLVGPRDGQWWRVVAVVAMSFALLGAGLQLVARTVGPMTPRLASTRRFSPRPKPSPVYHPGGIAHWFPACDSNQMIAVASTTGTQVQASDPLLALHDTTPSPGPERNWDQGLSDDAGLSRRLLLSRGIAAAAPLCLLPQKAQAGLLDVFLSPDALSSAPPTADVAQEPARSLLALLRDETPFTSWRQPWSKAPSELEVPATTALARFPAWLQSTWKVQAKLKDVRFPQGTRLVSDRLPGYRMASVIAALPNLGKEPTFRARFTAAGPDREFNVPEALEAFWPDARVTSVEAARLGVTRLTYQSPTVKFKAVEQHVTLTVIASEGGSIGEDRFISSDVYVQDNVEQVLRGLYQVVTLYQRDAEGQVTARQRVAAYLLDEDGSQFFDAQGRAVGIYDYNLSLTNLEAGRFFA